jgi:hypothetical protein
MNSPTPKSARLRQRDRDTIVSALRSGVVPRIGFQHIQVGRAAEIVAITDDVRRIADGGSAIRFVIGDYGAGKTFFLNLMRSVAAEHKLVTTSADLTPDRRLQAGGGQARALYSELMRNISTRSSPDGGALASVVERFVTSAIQEAATAGTTPDAVIATRLDVLSDNVGGYDFAQVIAAYWRGHDTGNEQLKSDAVRWLRAEFATKTDARSALGVRTIVDDNNFYDQLKLLARFVRLAGYSGLVVCLDEMVNLYKLGHAGARRSNYEQVLRIVNDGLQGNVAGLGVYFGGTPELLMDTRRGLYSYEALRSRLAENQFAVNGLVDHSGPVLRLANLTPEDMYLLLEKLRHVFAAGDPSGYLIPDEALAAFMNHCANRVGDAYFRTPRNTIKGFLDLLAILAQNPGLDWHDVLDDVRIDPEDNPDLAPLADDDTDGTAPASGSGPDELSSLRI